MKITPYSIFEAMSNPLISYLQLFGTISAADQEMIEAATQFRVVKEGEVLAGSGTVCREMFFICKGVLRIVKENEKGNEVTHFFLKENQFCTILYSFTNQVPTEESILAACDAEVLIFRHNTLYALYEKLPRLKTIMDEIIQKALLEKIQIRNAYLGEDSTTRYRQFMMRQPDIALRVPLSDVASYLGITPQSLSRIRKNIS
jgi:CRP/FNR family transcriptional regulator, anaerobic regulatory protein